MPTLIALRGCAGVGKSTLSDVLARQLQNCAVLSKDDVKDELVKLERDAVAAGVRIDTNDYAYPVLWKLAAVQLRVGLSVVLDTPLGRQEFHDAAKVVAQKAGADFIVVDCILELETHQQRLDIRRQEQEQTPDLLHVKPVDAASNREYYSKTSYQIDPDAAMVLHMGRDVQSLASEVLEFVRARKAVG
eukprot:TRINITY_DN26851_c0_g2_i1.p1 TRINITY_DN26851_c0_g2~~TRINITY_DN26851_c0_g2_i1.p1  ORF type:complete len:189 (+),score=30.02 TRINITY_DN26851_c0_g2_i1:64-630(+)